MHQRDAGGQESRVNHVGYLCEAHEKIMLIINILLQDKPDSSIIFCNTSECVDFVRKYLQRCGFIAPAARTKRSVVVASDEAVRDERKHYHCVINFDIPFAVRNYTARLGLLARNPDGRCISLLCDYYSDFAPPIIARYSLQCSWPASDFSAYRLPERNTVKDWLGEQEQPARVRNERGEREQPARVRNERGEREQPARVRNERGEREQPARVRNERGEREQPARGRNERGERGRQPRRGHDAAKRSKAGVSYASKKADQIVAEKSQRKSVWERILSLLTR